MNASEKTNSLNPAAAVLWASAFVIAALIIVQAGRLPGNAANAAVQADRSSYTLLTAGSGRGGEAQPDDLLYVMDSREQVLMVYEVEDARKKQVFLRDRYSLEELFTKARQ